MESEVSEAAFCERDYIWMFERVLVYIELSSAIFSMVTLSGPDSKILQMDMIAEHIV